MSPTPLPGPAALASLEVYIQNVVDQRLKAAGMLKALPGPRELRISRGMELQTIAQM